MVGTDSSGFGVRRHANDRLCVTVRNRIDLIRNGQREMGEGSSSPTKQEAGSSSIGRLWLVYENYELGTSRSSLHISKMRQRGLCVRARPGSDPRWSGSMRPGDTASMEEYRAPGRVGGPLPTPTPQFNARSH